MTTISNSVISMIKDSRKSILFSKTSAWVKKGNNSLFEVAVGLFYGPEICGLVRHYLLKNWLSIFIDKSSVGLYRDNK